MPKAGGSGGLLFRDGAPVRLLKPGRHFVARALDPFVSIRVERLSITEPRLTHPEIELVAKAEILGDEAQVLDLRSHQRAVVWVDGRFLAVLGPNVYAFWTVLHDVEIEVFDARDAALAHRDLRVILNAPGAAQHLEVITVAAGWVGPTARRLAPNLAVPHGPRPGQRSQPVSPTLSTFHAKTCPSYRAGRVCPS